jgi:hypothetical protein
MLHTPLDSSNVGKLADRQLTSGLGQLPVNTPAALLIQAIKQYEPARTVRVLRENAVVLGKGNPVSCVYLLRPQADGSILLQAVADTTTNVEAALTNPDLKAGLGGLIAEVKRSAPRSTMVQDHLQAIGQLAKRLAESGQADAAEPVPPVAANSVQTAAIFTKKPLPVVAAPDNPAGDRGSIWYAITSAIMTPIGRRLWIAAVVLGFGSFLILMVSRPRFSSFVTRIATQEVDDNFTDNQNGWSLGTSTSGTQYAIDKGAYTITVTKTNANSWGSPAILFPEDMDVQVDVRVPTLATAPDWEYSIHLRTATWGSVNDMFYNCVITKTGAWTISIHTTADTYTRLIGGTLSQSANFQSANTLRCTAKGDLISMYFDGQLLGSVHDSAVPRNGNPKYMALSAYNGQNGGNSVQAVFTNLKVRPAQ